MKLNIGDYVRTKDGYIRKIKNVDIEDGIPIYLDKPILEDDTKWRNCYQVMGCIQEEHIIKSSSNIIDLIEAGDYVNGDRVVEHAHEPGRLFVENVYVGGKGQTTIEDYSYELTSKYCYDDIDFIKSIVTKEQFESMEYKIGE